jgi:hypothetical protein
MLVSAKRVSRYSACKANGQYYRECRPLLIDALSYWACVPLAQNASVLYIGGLLPDTILNLLH